MSSWSWTAGGWAALYEAWAYRRAKDRLRDRYATRGWSDDRYDQLFELAWQVEALGRRRTVLAACWALWFCAASALVLVAWAALLVGAQALG